MEYPHNFHHLLDLAEAQGYSPQSGYLLDDAVRLALENSDESGAILAKYLYIYSVAPIEPEKALVSFAWTLARRELALEVLPFGALAQLFGIALGILRSYPIYSIEQIEATFEQMVALYAETGLGKRDLEHQRIYLALSLGRREEAQEAFDSWGTYPPDVFSCAVCDRGTRVIYNLHLERFDNGLMEAEPLLMGELSCEHGQPLISCAASMVPLLRKGRKDDAERAFQTSQQLLGDLSYAGIWAAGRILTYSALIGDLQTAQDTLLKHASVALHHGTPTDRFGYLNACRALAKSLAVNGKSTAQIQHLFPVQSTDPSVLALELERQISEIATAFDTRNGNEEYTRIISLFDSVFDDILSAL